MSTLYITQPGCMLRKQDQRIRVTKDKETLIDVPMLRVESVVSFGPTSITPAAMYSLMEAQIPITMLNEHGRLLGRVEPPFSKNSLLRRAQFEASQDPARSLAIATAFVAGKLANQRTYLVRARRERKCENLRKPIGTIKRIEQRLNQADSLDTLRGHEGAASRAYFSGFAQLIQPDRGFIFTKRVSRPPDSPVNAMLGFGYTLLAKDVAGILEGIGYDPYVGYLHCLDYGRTSLAVDLMEEFRAIIVDAVVLACINKRILTPKDFDEHPGGVIYLSDTGRKRFLQQYEERKRTEILHPFFAYKASYMRCIELQGRILAKTLTGEIPSYLPFRIR